MEVGRYCFPVVGGYYNSLRHRLVAEADLGGQLMLRGQEEAAVMERLLNEESTTIGIIPSMECNLRCPHCYVAHMLKKPGSDEAFAGPAIDRVLGFIDRVCSWRGHNRVNCHVVGGEPFLHVEFCRALAAYCRSKAIIISTTTNGVWDFDQVAEAISLYDSVMFSIDGTPERHNAIRKPLMGDRDTFAVAYRNMARCIETMPHVAVAVQGSFYGQCTVEEANRYRVLMLLAGVKPCCIRFGAAVGTERKPSGEAYLQALPREMRRNPCCDHMLGRNLVVYGGKVYPTYYRLTETDALCTIDDSMETLASRYLASIETMPMLKDKTCMNECKAVGGCWGLCTNSCPSLKDGPSSVCDRRHKEEKVAHWASEAARMAAG